MSLNSCRVTALGYLPTDRSPRVSEAVIRYHDAWALSSLSMKQHDISVRSSVEGNLILQGGCKRTECSNARLKHNHFPGCAPGTPQQAAGQQREARHCQACKRRRSYCLLGADASAITLCQQTRAGEHRLCQSRWLLTLSLQPCSITRCSHLASLMLVGHRVTPL